MHGKAILAAAAFLAISTVAVPPAHAQYYPGGYYAYRGYYGYGPRFFYGGRRFVYGYPYGYPFRYGFGPRSYGYRGYGPRFYGYRYRQAERALSSVV